MRSVPPVETSSSYGEVGELLSQQLIGNFGRRVPQCGLAPSVGHQPFSRTIGVTSVCPLFSLQSLHAFNLTLLDS